jgi:PAS domain S-box-containing protein
MVLIIPAVVFCAYLLWEQAKLDRDLSRVRASYVARVVLTNVDAIVERSQAEIQDLWESDRLGEADPTVVSARLTQTANDIGAEIALLDPTGATIALARPDGVAKHQGVVPLRREEAVAVGGVEGYRLVATFDRNLLLAKSVADALPPGWSAEIDGGRTVPPAPRDPDVISRDPPSSEVRSPITGWTVTVAAGRSELASVLASLAVAALAGAALLALSAVLAFVIGRRIALPMAELAEKAEALGRLEPVHPSSPSYREAEAVSAALAAASAEIVRRDDDLRLREKRDTVLIESLPALVWVLKRDGTTVRQNRRVAEYMGSADLAPAAEWRSVVHPDDADNVAGAWAAALTAGVPSEHHARLRRHDGVYRWHQIRLSPIDAGPGDDVTLVVATDVEDLKQAQALQAALNAVLETRIGEAIAQLGREESERRKAEDQLRQSQKMQAISRLAGGIAHSFNNKLTVINANIDSVVRKIKDRPLETKRLLSALVAADQASGLISKLLTFARRDELNAAVVDVSERITALADLLDRSLLGDAVEVRFDLPEDLWPIQIDAEELDTAIVNLATNARDAMPRGGLIAISARNVRAAIGSGLNDQVEITVRDSGEGIEPENLDRVFEPFFSTKPAEKGVGLGLSQVYAFALQSGGSARVESAPGQGTAVHLRLPRASVAARLGEQPLLDDIDDDEEVTLRRGRLLVVDDEPDVAQAIEGMLEQLGYSVTLAIGAEEALAAVQANRFDLVLSDVTMPGGQDGVALGRQLRVMRPQLPVLLITGNPRALGDASEFPILIKPINSASLGEAIRRAMEEAGRSAAPDADDKIVSLFDAPRRRDRAQQE